MYSTEQEYTDLKVDVGVLKTQIFTLSQLCEKMDKVIERLVDVHDQHISKVYEAMDDQRKEKDEDIAEVHERVDVVLDKLSQTEKRIMEEFQSLKKAMSDHSAASKAQFEKINQWKWTLAGGIIVITWLISRVGFDTLLKVLH
jgi:chromosome segregation ATPase